MKPDHTHPCPICGADVKTGGICVACALGDAYGEADEVAEGSLGRIGGYELIEIIARGGMGIVYRARQSDPAREVALKALPGAELTSNEARQRFRIESQAMAKLEHPHILPVYELGEEDTTPFFTMKLAAGGTLSQRMEGYAGQWRQIAEFIATIAEAVQFAHSHGVLHRDLKPGNILFDEDDQAYVSDFGLAKLIDSDADLTRTITMMGTPKYMAPEIVQKNGGITTASDVWSLGVILYELLAGQVPFQGENIPAVLRAVVEDKPTPLAPAVPRDLAVITLKALQKDPARRYVTAQEFADDLRRWLAGEPIHARPVALAERAWLWAKRKPALAGALALLAFTLVGSGVLLVRSNENLRAVDTQRRAEIHRALLEKADAERQSMTPGRRERALNLVREALSFGSSVQARSVAASALAVSDVRVTQTWPVGRIQAGASPMTFTADLSQHLALVPAAQVGDPLWKEGAIGLWHTADHTLLKQVPLTDRQVFNKPTLSQDARWMAVVVKYYQLEIWDLQAESRVQVLQSSTQTAAQFHPLDGTLIAGLNGELVRIRLPELRRETLATGLVSTRRLSISPDGRFVAFSQNRDIDGVTKLMRLEVRSLTDGSRVYSSAINVYGDIVWTPDSTFIAVFDRNTSFLGLHDIRRGEAEPRELVRSLSTGRRVAVWPDGRTLGWAGNGGFLHLHDLWLAEPLMRIPATAMSLEVSADGSRFVFSPSSETAATAEMLPPSILVQRKAPAAAERSVDKELAVSPDGRWIATADSFGITLWQAGSMTPLANRLAHAAYQSAENLHFSADSRQLRFYSANTKRSVWDIAQAADGSVSLAGPGADAPRAPHTLSAASINGIWEATTRSDEKSTNLYLWSDGEIATQVKRTPNPYKMDNHSRLLSPDGRWAAYGCVAVESAPVPGFTYVVHFDADNHRTMLSEKASHVHLAISPDSRWLVGGEGTDYVIWDSTTWQKVHQVPEHLSDSVPGSAAFSPDGRLLALEVEHGKIRLLRPSTWEEILTLSPPQNLPLVRMAFSPDGKHLYTTGGQILHRWDIEKLQAELTAMGICW